MEENPGELGHSFHPWQLGGSTMIGTSDAPVEPRRPFAALLLVAAALAAVVVDWSGTHAGHHADSLIPVLASLHHWEPYYWGSDRNGQLLPLLASPWDDPFTNLLVQVGLSVFAGVAALGLFARLLAPSCGLAAAAGAWALILFGYTEYVRFNMLNPCQPYTVSLLCAGAGLLAAFGAGRSWWRWTSAAGLFAVVGWVNIGIGMNLGPWLLFGWLFAGRRAEFIRGIGLVAFGTAVGLGLKRLSHYPGTPFTILPRDKWVTGWEGVWRDLTTHFGTNLELSVGLLAVGFVWLLVPATRSAAVGRVRDGCAAVAALALSFAFVGTTELAAGNGYTARYLFPSLVLLNVAAAGAALGPPLERFRPTRRRWLERAAALLIPALAVGVYGWPSVRAARTAVEGLAADHTRAVLAHRCTHVSGPYWDVWPAVFRANMALAERGEARVVWGLAPRAEPTRPQWSAVPPAEVRLGHLVRPVPGTPPPEADGGPPPEFPHLRLTERAPSLLLYAVP